MIISDSGFYCLIVVLGVIVSCTEVMAGPAQSTENQGALAISGISSSATPTAVTVTWSTNQPATSRLDWGTSPDALTSSVVGSTLSTAHSLTMNGLTPGTTYWIEITSVNPQGQVVKKSLGGPANPEPVVAPAVAAPAAVPSSTKRCRRCGALHFQAWREGAL